MAKRQDIDAALKAFADKAKQLKDQRVRLLGELVIATGADKLTDNELAGALGEIAATAHTNDGGGANNNASNESGATATARREAWAQRGAEYFRKRVRARPRPANDSPRNPANDDRAQSPSGKTGAT